MAEPWPIAFAPAEGSLYLQTLTAQYATPSGQTALLGRAERWVAEVSIRFGDRAEQSEILGWLGRLRGPGVVVSVPDWEAPAPRGTVVAYTPWATALGVTRWGDGTGWTDGTGYHEGVGVPSVAGGAGYRLCLVGCRPGAADILAVGDPVQAADGRAHMVTAPGVVDAEGVLVVTVAPSFRGEPVRRGPVQTNIHVHMRLQSDDAAKTTVQPPCRGVYQLTLAEVIG